MRWSKASPGKRPARKNTTGSEVLGCMFQKFFGKSSNSRITTRTKENFNPRKLRAKAGEGGGVPIIRNIINIKKALTHPQVENSKKENQEP